MKTVAFRLLTVSLITGIVCAGTSVYAQRPTTSSAPIILRKRTPLIKLPPELAAPDKATLQVRSNQVSAAQKFIASNGDFSLFQPASGTIKYIPAKKPLPVPNEAFAVLLTPTILKTDTAYLELTAPESVSGDTAHFVQKRAATLGSPDGFFWPDSFASFGFAAKKDHGYLITVKAKKLSQPDSNFVLFPVADGLGGGTMYTQQPQMVIVDAGVQDIEANQVVLTSKDGWYGFRIALIGEGTWDMSSVSIKEINSLLGD